MSTRMISDVLAILVEGATAVLVAMGGNTIKLLMPRVCRLSDRVAVTALRRAVQNGKDSRYHRCLRPDLNELKACHAERTTWIPIVDFKHQLLTSTFMTRCRASLPLAASAA